MAKRSEKQIDPPDEPPPDKGSGKIGYKILASLGATAGTAVARKAVKATWRTATGKPPPETPEHPDVRWGEAATWAAVSAAAVAVAKLMAQRRVAATWRRASGVLPPGLDESAD
ncbi:MAG TPA: DUF4235 domain-containing protein [Mycobacteriales bacterium]|jgi:hypothetical protein|nr:DUF4235 domain-containing protein [Mycobacteriales bacterium]